MVCVSTLSIMTLLSSAYICFGLFCWYWLGDLFCFVFVFGFVKPKGKEQFKWWTFMRYQSPRMPSLERTKVAVLKGGTGDWCEWMNWHNSFIITQSLFWSYEKKKKTQYRQTLKPVYSLILFLWRKKKLISFNFPLIK